MSADPKLEKIIEYLKTEFKPTRIFLFGSRANGKAGANSDYDLVVVSNDLSISKWAAFDKARKYIFEQLGVLADVWVYSESDFNDWSEEFGSIPETAKSTGIEL